MSEKPFKGKEFTSTEMMEDVFHCPKCWRGTRHVVPLKAEEYFSVQFAIHCEDQKCEFGKKIQYFVVLKKKKDGPINSSDIKNTLEKLKATYYTDEAAVKKIGDALREKYKK